MNERAIAIAILWQAMMERAEQMHDASVAGQRRANARSAGRIAILAHEVATLAAAAKILRQRREGVHD